jgi:invasion protein IalB
MMKPRILLFAGALLASTNWAAAQAPTSIGTFSVWNAYVSNDPGGKVCFAASQPQSSKYSRTVSSRGDTYFMVTTIPSKSIKNEASTIVGYPFKASSDVTVDVDGAKFKMFFNDATGETSWAVPDQEAALIEAMKKGSKMTISSTSSRGTDVTDNYSLSGITAALDAIAKECQ